MDITAHWHWPQWTWVIMCLFSLIMAAALNGEPKTGKHSAIGSLIGAGITVFILACGGFFG